MTRYEWLAAVKKIMKMDDKTFKEVGAMLSIHDPLQFIHRGDYIKNMQEDLIIDQSGSHVLVITPDASRIHILQIVNAKSEDNIKGVIDVANFWYQEDAMTAWDDILKDAAKEVSKRHKSAVESKLSKTIGEIKNDQMRLFDKNPAQAQK